MSRFFQVSSSSNTTDDESNAEEVGLQVEKPRVSNDGLLDTANPLPLPEASRYLRDFEEVGILGKGGFGVVYHVKNKLDGQSYAIKKVPISAARVQRIRSRGQPELDELLRELRSVSYRTSDDLSGMHADAVDISALARLEHPNIVRYYAGWIDWSHFQLRPASSRVLPQWSQSQAISGAENVESASLSRVITQSDPDDVAVVFEDSGAPKPTVLSTELANLKSSALYESAAGQSAISGSLGSRPESSVFSESTDGLVMTSGPFLALHIQMGMYPLTLADFIAPPEMSVNPLAHCFHLEPTLDILVAILDGVEYLHDQGIIHRDLKPANIFLAASNNPRAAQGSVDLFLCGACRATGHADPVKLSIRIGDFGLVTAIAQPDSTIGDTSKPVGTELYRPTSAGSTSRASPSLDVFAVGIIAFELLWNFHTRMERQDTLQRLKSGEFPARFSERIGDKSGQVMRWIKNMLTVEDGTGNIASLKEWLCEIKQSLKKPAEVPVRRHSVHC